LLNEKKSCIDKSFTDQTFFLQEPVDSQSNLIYSKPFY